MNITKLYPVKMINSSAIIINSTTTARQEIVKEEVPVVPEIPDHNDGSVVQPFYLSNAFVTLILVVVAIVLIFIALFLWLQWRLRSRNLQQRSECELREMNRYRRQQLYASSPVLPSRQQWHRRRELRSQKLESRIITTTSSSTRSIIRATDFPAYDDDGKNSPLGPGPVLQIPASSRLTYWKAPGDIQVHYPIQEAANEISTTKVVAPSLVKLEGQTLRRVAKSLIRIMKSSSGLTMIPLPKKEIKKQYQVQYVSRRTRHEHKRRLRLERDQVEQKSRPNLEKWPRKCNSRSTRTNRVGCLCNRRYFERKQRRIQKRKKQHRSQ